MPRVPRRAHRLALSALVFLVATIAAIAAERAARAEPHLAIREGYRCSQCHINKTGGGKRNAFGVVYSQTVMPMWKPWRGVIDPRLGEWASAGADVRVQNVTGVPTSTSSPASGLTLTAPTLNSFRIAEANLYAELSIVPGWLSIYVDEIVGPESASAREAFVLLHGLPLGGWLKAGRLLYPWGIRVPDDTTFLREITGFNYANQDLGAEIGIEPGPLYAVVQASNGTGGSADGNTQKQVTATAGLSVTRHLRFGFSYAWNNATSAGATVTRRVVGGYLGLGLGRLALLTEVGVLRDYSGPAEGATTPAPAARMQWALLAEADLLITRGLRARVAYDYHDPDTTIAEDARVRWTFALEATVVPFLRLGLLYHVRRDIPQRVAGNQDLFIVQLHGFL